MKRRQFQAPRRSSVAAIYHALGRAYGLHPRPRLEPPVNVLVATILSQNTSDVNSGRVYRSLRKRFPRWETVAAAAPRDIARAIRSGGLARIKSGRIRQVLRLIRKREGKLNLARLKTMNNGEALAYLADLPGVGMKTACCVLLFGFGRPVMPVDTHVARIAGRLGWVRPATPRERMSAILERLIPARWILSMHLNLIEHGRRVCRPHRPACGRCILISRCAWAHGAEAMS